MISVRELGTPAPMVKFLLDTPAALIESIPGKVHDVEGVHDRLSRQVSGWEASQVLKTRLDQSGTISKSREGPRRSRTGVTSKMTVTYLSPYGVWRHSQGT